MSLGGLAKCYVHSGCAPDMVDGALVPSSDMLRLYYTIQSGWLVQTSIDYERPTIMWQHTMSMGWSVKLEIYNPINLNFAHCDGLLCASGDRQDMDRLIYGVCSDPLVLSNDYAMIQVDFKKNFKKIFKKLMELRSCHTLAATSSGSHIFLFNLEVQQTRSSLRIKMKVNLNGRWMSGPAATSQRTGPSMPEPPSAEPKCQTMFCCSSMTIT